MKRDNISTLDRMANTAQFGGMISAVIGIAVTLMDLFNKDFRHIQSGIYILITGYALNKMGKAIQKIVIEEEHRASL